MNKSPQHNQQSKSEVEEIPMYLRSTTWKVTVTGSISENKCLVGFVREKIPINNI